MPGLRQQLVTHRMFTPFDFRDTLHAHQGSAFSLEPILTQSAGSGRITAMPTLLTIWWGWHASRCRCAGVIGSAKATAQLMVEDLTG